MGFPRATLSLPGWAEEPRLRVSDRRGPDAAHDRAVPVEEDARGIGFDEGPKTPDWVASLEQRGISVARDVCRDEAAAVLRYYAENGGMIYNARQGA